MATRIGLRLIAATMTCGTVLSLLIAVSHGQVAPPLSEIKITVVDQSGARIPDSDVVFKGDSKTIVSHTGSDGAGTVALPSGRYAVAASHHGFLKNEVVDFQVVAPEPRELRVVLMFDPHSEICGILCGCSPCPLMPTITSEVPNVIDEPRPTPPLQPAAKTKNIRSLRCLYLWKCSIS